LLSIIVFAGVLCGVFALVALPLDLWFNITHLPQTAGPLVRDAGLCGGLVLLTLGVVLLIRWRRKRLRAKT
jgi:hypothetical protein